ncbi:hypothetical protein [Paenibacillus odorifer]|uniref:hypothetical protein n=1 Tax=Paenibacillus odorifer TaxID=189426 RepID=UPI0015C38312|nr:hypothetical protein [Paenibacillus odorifer]
MEHRVVVRSFDNDESVQEFKWSSNLREVEKIDDGINRNLNHDKFYTLIEDRDN